LRAVDLRNGRGVAALKGKDDGTHDNQGEHMITAAARPHVFWVGEDPSTQERVRAWPVGHALLETLGGINSDVGEALAHERARLRGHGYPEDLPLPALWWTPRAPVELVELVEAVA
jgi:hypothetical protein